MQNAFAGVEAFMASLKKCQEERESSFSAFNAKVSKCIRRQRCVLNGGSAFNPLPTRFHLQICSSKCTFLSLFSFGANTWKLFAVSANMPSIITLMMDLSPTPRKIQFNTKIMLQHRRPGGPGPLAILINFSTRRQQRQQPAKWNKRRMNPVAAALETLKRLP